MSQQYGEVLNLVLSSKRPGTAVVEFATVKAAVSAAGGLQKLVLPGQLPHSVGPLPGDLRASTGPRLPQRPWLAARVVSRVLRDEAKY